jgi:hypothetical protein
LEGNSSGVFLRHYLAILMEWLKKTTKKVVRIANL